MPRSGSPGSAHTDEGDHGAVGAAAPSRYQVDGCVGDDYPPVLVQGGDFENLAVQSAALHRVLEAPPVQGSKDGRYHDIETSPQRVARRMPYDVRDPITPLMDDALTVDGHCCATVVGRLGSAHTVITTSAVSGFTEPVTRLGKQWSNRPHPYRHPPGRIASDSVAWALTRARRRLNRHLTCKNSGGPGWCRTNDLPRVKRRRCQNPDVRAGQAGRTGPILGVRTRDTRGAADAERMKSKPGSVSTSGQHHQTRPRSSKPPASSTHTASGACISCGRSRFGGVVPTRHIQGRVRRCRLPRGWRAKPLNTIQSRKATVWHAISGWSCRLFWSRCSGTPAYTVSPRG